MPLDPNTDIDEGGDQISTDDAGQDYQDQLERQQVGIGSPSFRSTAPGVYSPTPAPAPTPAPQPQGIAPPPVSRRPPPSGGDYEVVRSSSFTPQAAPDSGKSLTWKDYGDQVWRGVLGTTSSVAGAVDFVQHQIDNDPDLKTYAGNVRDWATQHAQETLDGMSPRAQQVLSASLLGYVPGSLSRDAQGNQIPTPGSVGWSAYLAMHLTEMIPDGLAMLVPGAILGKAAVKTAELFGVATKAVKAGETAGETVETLTKAGETAASVGHAVGTGAYFGTEGAGQFYNQIHQEIGDASDADLKAGSAYYAQLRNSGMSEGQAKHELTQRAAPFVYGAAAAGAVGGAAMGLGKGIVRGALTGAAAMGAQGGATSALQQTAEQQVGTRQGYDLGSILADTVSAGAQGAVLGAAGGAFHRGGAAAGETEPSLKPGVGPDEGAALRDQLQIPGPPEQKLLTYEGGQQQALPSPTGTSINVPAGPGQVVQPPGPVRFGDVNIAPVTRGPELTPTPAAAPPPAAQAAIDASRRQSVPTAEPPAGGAPGPPGAPAGPRPSEGMSRQQLSDALTGQVDPKALKSMSAKDMATRYDRLAPAPETTTVVEGSGPAPPTSEPETAPTQAGGAAPPSPLAGVGSLPVATEAAGTKVPEAPGLPEKPKTAAAIAASRRKTAKGQMAEPGAPVRGAGAVEAEPVAAEVETPAVEQARADRVGDLAEAVRAIPAPRGSALEAVLRKAQRYLSESIGKTDGSKDAVAELIHNWMEKEPTASYPGTKVTAKALGEHLMEHAAGQRPVEREGARAEIAEVRREEAARTGAESKTITGESIEQAGETRSEGAEGTSAITPVVKKAEELPDTTDHRRTADNLIQKVLNHEMTPAEADARYGKPQPGAGAKRRWPRLADRLHDWIAHAEDPKVERGVLEQLASTQNNEKLTPHQKSTQTKKLTAMLERTGPEFASELREHLRGMEDPVGQAADQARQAERAAARADVEQRTAERTRPLEDAPGPPTPDGISPRSSRYVLSSSQDPRVDGNYLRALRASEQHGVPYTTHDFLRGLVQDPLINSALRPFRMLATRLLGRARDIPMMSINRALDEGHITPEQHADLVQRNVYGAYDPEAGHILVNPNAVRAAGTHVETGLHEIMHSITSGYIRDLERNNKYHPDLLALQAIRNELRTHLDAANAAGELSDVERQRIGYAVQNVHELHTQLMTDPVVQAFAASRQASPELRAALSRLGFAPREQGRSVWRHFTDWVRRAIGLRTPASASEYTMLDHLLRPMTDITDRAAEYNKRLLPDDPVLRAHAEPLYDAASGSMSERARDIINRTDPAGWADRAKRAILAVTNRDAIVDWNRDILPGLDAWRTADENIRSASSEFASKYGDDVQALTGRLNKADDKKALSELMTDVGIHEAHVGDNLSTDANAHLKTPEQQATAKDLQARYNGLSAKDKALYNETRQVYSRMYADERAAQVESLLHGFMPEATKAQRDAFTTSVKSKASLDKFLADPDHSTIAKAFGDDWGAQRALVRGMAQLHNMGFVQGDYFPLRRFGNFVVRYGDRADPANYGVENFESYKKAQDRRAELVRQGRDDVYQVARRDTAHLNDLAPQPALAGELADAMSRHGFDDAHIQHMTDLMNDIMLRHATHSEAARARMRRRGVRGASTDQARVLASDFVSKQARMGYTQYGLDRAQRLQDIYNEMKAHEGPSGSPGAAVRAANVYQELVKRTTSVGEHDDLVRKIGRAANGFSFVQSLMSPSHMLTSSIETHANSMALMGARHGYVSTGLALTRAIAQASPAIKGGAKNFVRALGNRLKSSDWNMVHVIRDEMASKTGADKAGINMLSNELIRTGLVDHTQLQDIRHEMNPAGVVGTGAQKVWNVFYNSNAAMAHAVDVMNKFAVAKAAYDMEIRRPGTTRQAAVDYAIQMTRRVMPNYTTGNRERIAQHPMMSALLQFKRYGMHMYALMANLTRESLHGPNRLESAKALAGLLATHATMAGVLTLIADPLRYIGGAYDIATNAPSFHNYQNDVRGFLADTFGKELGEVMARGVPHLAGIDLHRRVGLENLLEIPEMSGFNKEGAAQVLLGLSTGATGENLENLVSGVSKFMHGDIMGGLTTAIPRVFRDAMKGVNLATQGVTDKTGKVILPADRVGMGSVAAQALGFQPSVVSEFREGRNAVLEAREEAQARHTQLTQRWLNADPGDRQNVMQEIRLYNQDPANVGSRITMEQLLRDQQTRRKQEQTPYGLRLPKRGAPQLMEAGRFANVQ